MNNILENIQEFKVSFHEFLQDRKKIRALENVSSFKKMKSDDLQGIDLIKSYLRKRFLEQYEKNFLKALLDKLSLDYLDWCCKTPWVKRQIAALSRKEISQQILINFDKQKEVPRVLLQNIQKTHLLRKSARK